MSTAKHKIAYLFSDRLQAVMDARGIKQKGLAEKVGVSQPAVSGWLNGATPDAQQLLAISNALGVSMDYLMKGLDGIKEPEVVPVLREAPPAALDKVLSDLAQLEEHVRRIRRSVQELIK